MLLTGLKSYVADLKADQPDYCRQNGGPAAGSTRLSRSNTPKEIALVEEHSARPPAARAKLLDAAYLIMGESGLPGVTIADICARGNVGIGSFYRHFTTKEELAEAVFTRETLESSRLVGQLVLDTADPLLGTSYGHRAALEKAEQDPVWAAFVANVAEPLGLLDRLWRQATHKVLRTALERAGMNTRELHLRVGISIATAHSLIRALHTGSMSSRDAHRSVAYMLLIYGFSWPDAVRATELSMDDLRAEMRSKPWRD